MSGGGMELLAVAHLAQDVSVMDWRGLMVSMVEMARRSRSRARLNYVFGWCVVCIAAFYAGLLVTAIAKGAPWGWPAAGLALGLVLAVDAFFAVRRYRARAALYETWVR